MMGFSSRGFASPFLLTLTTMPMRNIPVLGIDGGDNDCDLFPVPITTSFSFLGASLLYYYTLSVEGGFPAVLCIASKTVTFVRFSQDFPVWMEIKRVQEPRSRVFFNSGVSLKS